MVRFLRHLRCSWQMSRFHEIIGDDFKVLDSAYHLYSIFLTTDPVFLLFSPLRSNELSLNAVVSYTTFVSTKPRAL